MMKIRLVLLAILLAMMVSVQAESKVIPLSPDEKAEVEKLTMTSLPGLAGITKYPLQHSDQGIVVQAPGRPPAVVQIESKSWGEVQGILPDQVPAVVNLAPSAPGAVIDTLFDVFAGIKLHAVSMGLKLQEVGAESDEGKKIIREGRAWALILQAIEPAIFAGSENPKK